MSKNTSTNKKLESRTDPKPSTSFTNIDKHTPAPVNTPAANPETTNCSVDSDYTQPVDTFVGLKFIISGFTEDEYSKLKDTIESMAGSVVSKTFKGVADYAVVPLFGSSLYLTAEMIVNDLWIAECKYESEIRDVMYYHRPIPVSPSEPLQGCVVTISSYTKYERNFLTNLIQQLGGTFQEQFARVSCPEKNILPSTHLLSLEASGKKYSAALKWNLPVINKEWLLDCARTGNLVPEQYYLVGDAIGLFLCLLFI